MKMKEPTSSTPTEGITKIHNVRFYNLSPRSINCLSYNKSNHKLALSRSDASIEIWDLSYAPCLEKTIPGEINGSVEGLGWAGERLFSAGLSGEVIEWDLCRIEKKQSQLVTGSAIWCLDIDKEETCIALGTEEGYLNIYEIRDDGFNYKILFDKQEGRILCCKFDHSGEFMVTGSLDAIRIWSTKTGHALYKMTLSRVEAKKETIVWSLQILKNFVIVAGDSRGQVTVWDGKMGTQIESHQVLKADVLAVAVNEEENILVCSGIDPIIRIYALTTIKKEEHETKRWVKFLQRSVHDHDVKALVCVGIKVFSGGVDGYLGISSYSKEHPTITKHGPFLQPPCASIAPQRRMILLRYPNYLEIWRLGTSENKVQLTNDDEKDTRKFLVLEKGPEKILELKSIGLQTIVSSCISPDACWLIYSTISTIRLFSINEEEDKPQIKISRVKDLPEQFEPSRKILFASNSKVLFLVKHSNQIDVFNILSSCDVDHVETIDTSKAIKDAIHLAQLSSCGRYLVVADTCRTVAVWFKSKKHWKHHINLPKYIAPTTAIALHESLPRLVATFSDGKIFEYDLEEMRFLCSANQKFVPNSYTHCVNNIVLDSRNENVIILHNDSNLFVLRKMERKQDEDENEENESKVPKYEERERVSKLKLKFKKTYEHFVHLAWLSEDEMVAVGVNPVSLIEQLPPTLRQKKFGAS